MGGKRAWTSTYKNENGIQACTTSEMDVAGTTHACDPT